MKPKVHDDIEKKKMKKNMKIQKKGKHSLEKRFV